MQIKREIKILNEIGFNKIDKIQLFQNQKHIHRNYLELCLWGKAQCIGVSHHLTFEMHNLDI